MSSSNMSISNCGCKSSMDIRGRCCPYRNNKKFLECPARLDTALFHFENDSEICKELEKDDNGEYKIIISKFLKSIKIKYWKDTMDFTEMFIKSVEDSKWNTEKIEAIKELEFEKKMMKMDWLRFKNAPLSLDFSPSGEFLATSHVNSKAVFLWSNKTYF